MGKLVIMGMSGMARARMAAMIWMMLVTRPMMPTAAVVEMVVETVVKSLMMDTWNMMPIKLMTVMQTEAMVAMGAPRPTMVTVTAVTVAVAVTSLMMNSACHMIAIASMAMEGESPTTATTPMITTTLPNPRRISQWPKQPRIVRVSLGNLATGNLVNLASPVAESPERAPSHPTLTTSPTSLPRLPNLKAPTPITDTPMTTTAPITPKKSVAFAEK
mmetsp:Transcript_4908/g.10826  ORF Transcript_4908/g.10826 Transcript_4908/m.10826 type:complete len:217 (+) Transcript_4908:705-1355(+)